MTNNNKKSKVMVFNPTRKFQFPPELKIGTGDQLEVIEEVKLLGLLITSDMKWHNNTEYITTKAKQRIWILRRLRVLGIGNEFLWDVYTKEIRPLLEYACPVWNGNLSLYDQNLIEKVQKSVLRLLLGEKYTL